MSVLCVLPARLGSERIPDKPLQMIAGRPLVEWTWRAARSVPQFDEVCVATDSKAVAERVRAFGGRAVLTAGEHLSGTDRVAEAAESEWARGYDVVVNFQADEPFADSDSVGRAVLAVRDGTTDIATVAAPIRGDAEWRSEAVVKVVVGANGRALYFSRAAVPYVRGGKEPFSEGPESRFLRHVGVYVMRRDAMKRWVAAPPSPLEQLEKLEQLRALEVGLRIQVIVGPSTEPGVDVPDDLERAARILSGTWLTTKDKV